MRISSDPEDRGYIAAGICAKVFLDDLPLTLCVTADEEAGAAYCHKADSAGYIAVSDSGEFELETLRGRVRIDLSDCAWPADLVGFDVWMRARAERAHREFMDRTARALPCR